MALAFASALFVSNSNAQVLMSAGNYNQDFNSLSSSADTQILA